MAEAGRAGDLAYLRSAVEAKVKETSLRDVARDIGMPPNSVRNFVLGRAPYGQNLRRLHAWQVREMAGVASNERIPASVANAALDLLVQHIPAPERAVAKSDLIATLAEITKEHSISGKQAPAWLKATVQRRRPK